MQEVHNNIIIITSYQLIKFHGTDLELVREHAVQMQDIVLYLFSTFNIILLHIKQTSSAMLYRHYFLPTS